MRKRLAILLVSVLSLSGCQKMPEELSVSRQKVVLEQELVPAILDDNYRNYYEIFVSSFADSNNDKIGDLKGIDSKLSYLHDIGYTGIWLTPIFTASSYHKYNTTDYFSIDPSFGTMDDLKNLVSHAHQLNIKVILDGVFNHCGKASSYYQNAIAEHAKKKEGKSYDEKKEGLIHFVDTIAEVESSSLHYHKADPYDFYYECNFDDDMPEFDFDHEVTYTFLQSIVDYYMSEAIGVDGFRLDGVKYYDLGNMKKNIAVLNRINDMVKRRNGSGYLIGECWIESSGDLSEYYDSSIDSFFWFPSGTGRGFLLSTGVEGRFKTNYLEGQQTMIDSAKGHIPAPFLDNHDLPRISDSDPRKTKFRLGLRDTLNGSIFNYYGDEIGMNSLHLPSTSDYRDANYRTHYPWNDQTHLGETEDPPRALAQISLFGDSVSQEKDPNSILNYEKKALLWRNSIPAIARGNIAELSFEDESINQDYRNPLLVVQKSYQGEAYRLLYNFSASKEVKYDTKGTNVISVLLADTKLPATTADTMLNLPPYSIALLKAQ